MDADVTATVVAVTVSTATIVVDVMSAATMVTLRLTVLTLVSAKMFVQVQLLALSPMRGACPLRTSAASPLQLATLWWICQRRWTHPSWIV